MSNVHALPTAPDGGLIWETPPDRDHTRPGAYACEALTLRARPGDWAIIRVYPLDKKRTGWALATTIRAGKHTDFPLGQFDAAARTVDGQVRVYVRYTGTPAEELAAR